MTLRLYNTLTKTKEDFAPLDPANVRMYVCGPTVYDFAHIGNARPVIVFDVLFRLLRHLYGAEHVTYVRNITDVDDKINARAAEIAAGKNISVERARAELTANTEKQFVEDVTALGCLPPTETPRATDNIPAMIAMIETLVANGHAYPAEGHVLFDVSSKPDYGKLARRSLDEMIAGARVEVAPYKKSPMDFVLWKPSDAATPGWDSPWGRGRPGWHIECSAMAGRYLGETFDIHGGGIDLVFPHHENEIAQSEAAHHGHPLAKVWMHNGFLQVEGEKMAKSAGNFVTIRELLLEDYGAVLRFNMLKTHYRQPVDWRVRSLIDSNNELAEWSKLVAENPAGEGGHVDQEFLEALLDDLNTPAAITRLRWLFGSARTDPARDLLTFRRSAEFLGISGLGMTGYLSKGISYFPPKGQEELARKAGNIAMRLRVATANHLTEAEDHRAELEKLGVGYSYTEDGDVRISFDESTLDEWVSEMLEARKDARAKKDFAESDRIRDELLAQGIILKDGPNGTTWEVKR